MFRGSVNSANINIRKLVENALIHNAVSVILAHNHISGVKQPSREDRETTRRVAEAFRTVDISFTDHIIIAGDEYVSMADIGMMNG
jgi:DNA repair protein RadC